MREESEIWSRREFFRSSSLILVGGFLPGSLLGGKYVLGSSISVPITLGGKTVGVKFTIVDNKYVIGTFSIPNNKKVGHYAISGPFDQERSASRSEVSFKFKAGGSGVVKIDPKDGSFYTNVKDIRIGKVRFQNSKNDEVASAQGFFQRVADKLNDLAAGIAVGITYLTGDSTSIKTSNGSTIYTNTDAGGGTIGSSGFMAESDIEGNPGVWY